MKHLILCVLLMLLLTGIAVGESTASERLTLPGTGISLCPPDGCTVITQQTADGDLLTAMRESSVALVLSFPDDALLQLQVQASGMPNMDFDTLGKKKLAILAEQIAAAAGRHAEIITLHEGTPKPTDPPAFRVHRCKHWICLSPFGSPKWPRQYCWLADTAGLELTLYADFPSHTSEETIRPQLMDMLLSLQILSEGGVAE